MRLRATAALVLIGIAFAGDMEQARKDLPPDITRGVLGRDLALDW